MKAGDDTLRIRALTWLVHVSLGLLLSSCHGSVMPEVRSAYWRGDYGRARDLLIEAEREDRKDAAVYRLERSVVEFAAGRPRDSIQLLRRCRDELDSLTPNSLDDLLGSVFLDDRLPTIRRPLTSKSWFVPCWR